jgi:branched-chain amino acid transport system permease protein
MTRDRLAFAGAVLVIALIPLVADNYVVRLTTFLCMYAALAFSWNFIGGYTGYPSFATAGFFGLGAYTGAIVQNAWGWLPVSWLAATLVVSGVAFLAGPMLLRMRGHYFAIGSIAIVEILRLLASSWTSLTGGGEGLNVRLLAGGPGYAGRVFLYSMMTAMIGAYVTTLLVDRGKLGFALRCIKQNEDAADMVGVDVNWSKTIAFTLSAVWCGTVGAIYASWVGYIDPGDAFSVLLALKVPVMVMLGGAGTVFGPAVGAWSFVFLEEMIWSQFLEYNRAVLGIVIIVLIFLLPGGLLRLQSPLRGWRHLFASRQGRVTEAP